MGTWARVRPSDPRASGGVDDLQRQILHLLNLAPVSADVCGGETARRPVCARMQYPFAENAVVVQMIVHDLTHATIAVPVLVFGIWRGYRAANNGDASRSTFYAIKCLIAAGWICYFLKGWVIPADITIDLAELRRQTVDPAFYGKGRIGYFNCTLQLSPTQSVHWSARKVGALKLADGSGFLWIEGNADEPQAIIDALAEVSKDAAQRRALGGGRGGARSIAPRQCGADVHHSRERYRREGDDLPRAEHAGDAVFVAEVLSGRSKQWWDRHSCLSRPQADF